MDIQASNTPIKKTWYTKVDDLIKVQGEIVSLQRWEASLKADILESLSPVKVGDVVAVQYNGYSNKDKGKPMKVTRVIFRSVIHDQKKLFIEATGDILKKDGTPGQYTGTAYYHIQYDDRI